MTKKQKKIKGKISKYLKFENVISLVIVLLLSFGYFLVRLTDSYMLETFAMIVSFIVLLLQVAFNKAKFSHSLCTLLIFIVLNIILGFILGFINYPKGGVFVYFNMLYALLFFVIYSVETAFKKEKYYIIVGIIIAIGVILYFALNYNIKHIRPGFWYKPIIYIYPEEDTDVEITVSNPENLTVTYPKYNDGWKVKALKDGTLIDKNNKKYYALYWEGKGDNNTIKNDGFIVKGEDTASFLEEKLETLGLNYKEANEFIMYWLPKLESNKYNYIRFKTMDEINSNMKLNITPEPDTLIRIMMEYKGLDKKIKVKEQKLERRERSGYSVIEWGGTEIK